MQVGVVGGGIVGVVAAIALRERGHEVAILDPGPLPHPDAASTDISKLVRMDYGRDALYTEMMERAFPRWEAWNARWPRPLFHRDGMLVLCPSLDIPGFEHDSWTTLRARGHELSRVNPARDLPAWRGFTDGYHNPVAGWVESGAVVEQLVSDALAAGVTHLRTAVLGLDGARLATPGGSLTFDRVVVAIGAWVGRLLPELAERIRAVGQPVLHFRPENADDWRAPRFPPWAADIARTGWYGFPANRDGLVKVANHGPGTWVDPSAPRVVALEWEARFRSFFAEHLPGLTRAPLVGARLCLYADSFDGDFWITPHPDRPGVVVAGGGSGHAFKFAPVLGEVVADAVEGRADSRFAWRDLGVRRTEDARFTEGRVSPGSTPT